MANDTPDAPPPEAPAAYLAAIGAKGGRRNSDAQRAARAQYRHPQAEAMVADYLAGAGSYAKLARKYGVHACTVMRAVKRARKLAEAAEEAASE